MSIHTYSRLPIHHQSHFPGIIYISIFDMKCSLCAMIGLNQQDSWIIVLDLCQLLGSSAIPPTILGDSTQVNWKQTACKATPEKSQRAGMSEVGCDGSSCLFGGVLSVGCAHTGSHVQGSHNLICSWRCTFTGWDMVCAYVCIWFQVYIAQELSTFFFFLRYSLSLGWLVNEPWRSTWLFLPWSWDWKCLGLRSAFSPWFWRSTLDPHACGEARYQLHHHHSPLLCFQKNDVYSHS